jgi:hypothetical protein
MSEMFINHVGNSFGTDESCINVPENFFIASLYQGEVQSSTVTQSGSLWIQRLLLLNPEKSLSVLQDRIEEGRLDRKAIQSHKNYSLVQLLNSWREGDEQEQRETLNFLKKALDEDRVSERKLFP